MIGDVYFDGELLTFANIGGLDLTAALQAGITRLFIPRNNVEEAERLIGLLVEALKKEKLWSIEKQLKVVGVTTVEEATEMAFT